MSSQSQFFNPTEDRMSLSGNGFQFPRLSTTQRVALSVSTADVGLVTYDTNLGALYLWTGSAWTPFSVGGGITGFTFSQATYAGRLTDIAQGSGADAAVILAPTGTGFFAVQVPDGTATGGNNRGTNAVDLQLSRSAATEVASGANSFTAGRRCTASGARDIAMGDQSIASGGSSFAAGEGNTASGFASTCFGNFSLASGGYSFCTGAGSIASGNSSMVLAEQCTASQQYAAAIGGRSHTVSGQYAICIGGRGNTASGSYSTCSGGQDSTASGQYSHTSGYGALAPSSYQRSHGFRGNGPVGGFQRVDVGLYNQTTNATPTRLFVDGSAENYVIPANSIVNATLRIQATTTTAGAQYAAWMRKLVLKRGVAVGTATLVGTPDVIGTDVGSNAGIPPAAWSFTITVDPATGSVNVTVTGDTTIRWTAHLDGVELVFA